jgi:7-cyano-7-deazaguanine synthase in queuosine biosynthesis
LNPSKSVNCSVTSLNPSTKSQHVSFNVGDDLRLRAHGTLGPRGISLIVSDLIDLAASVLCIERQLKRRRPSNPPKTFSLRMKVRRPEAWSERAVKILEELLQLLGNAVWKIEITGGLKKDPQACTRDTSSRKIRQVALFSGGLDSSCGAATLHERVNEIQLVSFYTLQRSLQSEISSALGFKLHAQWSWVWNGGVAHGRSFYYRTFLFLALAAAVAESWECRTIYQFENGLLATAIPPDPSWMMTKHAHPSVQRCAELLLNEVFGGEWEICNPFLKLTKAQCVQEALSRHNPSKLLPILHRTETCWSFHSMPKVGKKRKKRHLHCGVCIPCVIRRTALRDTKVFRDLLDDNVKNDPKLGLAFRSYFGLLDGVLKCRGSLAKFYHVLPSDGRILIDGGSLTLGELHELFRTFAGEFMRAYQLRDWSS